MMLLKLKNTIFLVNLFTSAGSVIHFLARKPLTYSEFMNFSSLSSRNLLSAKWTNTLLGKRSLKTS